MDTPGSSLLVYSGGSLASLGAIFDSASTALYLPIEPDTVRRVLATLSYLTYTTAILQTGSWGKNQGSIARELTAETQTRFPATFQDQGASLHKTPWPDNAGR